MKLLQVLLMRNLLNASRWHVTSISTMMTPHRGTPDPESVIFEYRVGSDFQAEEIWFPAYLSRRFIATGAREAARVSLIRLDTRLKPWVMTDKAV